MPGQQLDISWNGRPATAWLPDPLAACDVALGTAVVRRTEQAIAGVLRAADRLPAGWEPLARLLLRAEGVASSRIEGLRAPLADVVAAEAGGDVSGTAAWVADNLAVVSEALTQAPERPLAIQAMHLWHERLMRHGTLEPSMVGSFRPSQGWVGGRTPRDAAFVPPPPEHVGPLMDDLVAFANREDIDAITQAAVVHAQFETIHPYGDGNGRVGRVLILWVLGRRLHVVVPPPVSVLIADDVGGYLSGLHLYREGQLDAWVGWFADTVRRSGEAVSEWTDDVARLLQDWQGRLAGLRRDATALRVVDLLPEHPVISPVIAAERLSVSERAARGALHVLADSGVVEPFGAIGSRPGRPTRWWLARDLIDLVQGWTG